MLKILQLGDNGIDVGTFGGKAAGLSLLNENGFRVPDAIFIEANTCINEIEDTEFQKILRERLSPFCVKHSYNVAIRSSSILEDTFSDSLAGHFKTIMGNMTFKEVIQAIKEVISSSAHIQGKDSAMGVIVQQKIDADFSGVLFSSNPLNYSKKSMVISYTKGLGEELVSGSQSGQDIEVNIQGDDYIVNPAFDVNHILIDTLCRRVKKLEQQLNYPLDVEWAVKDNELYYLQCRPLASITKISTSFRHVDKESLKDLPHQLVGHDKVSLRLKSQEIGVFVSDAFVYTCNTCYPADEKMVELEKSLLCKGYSAVLIYPKRLSGKVIRSFVGNGKGICGNDIDCGRYDIHSCPKYKDILECLHSYSQSFSEEYWIGTTILLEIFDPIYTGVIQKIDHGYLIEITRGHFLTKGVVPTSQYTISKGKVISKKESVQKSWYKIIEGHVLLCHCDEGTDFLISLSDAEANCIVNYFDKLLSNNSTVVEFGIIKNCPERIQPYLIDYVDSGLDVNIEDSDISSGILSRGKITGRIVHVLEPEMDSLNLHFHDNKKISNHSGSHIIYFCKKPDIALLSLLEDNQPSNIGFVFQEGSVLCHLAVVLREKGIPAIKIGEFLKCDYPEGKIATLDAESKGICGKDRIKNE